MVPVFGTEPASTLRRRGSSRVQFQPLDQSAVLLEVAVAEAMWKERPIVASAVGGIADQVDHGTHGLLIDDPTDLRAFGEAVETVLRDRDEAARLAYNARARAVREFLGDRHLQQYGRLIERLELDPR